MLTSAPAWYGRSPPRQNSKRSAHSVPGSRSRNPPPYETARRRPGSRRSDCARRAPRTDPAGRAAPPAGPPCCRSCRRRCRCPASRRTAVRPSGGSSKPGEHEPRAHTPRRRPSWLSGVQSARRTPSSHSSPGSRRRCRRPAAAAEARRPAKAAAGASRHRAGWRRRVARHRATRHRAAAGAAARPCRAEPIRIGLGRRRIFGRERASGSPRSRRPRGQGAQRPPPPEAEAIAGVAPDLLHAAERARALRPSRCRPRGRAKPARHRGKRYAYPEEWALRTKRIPSRHTPCEPQPIHARRRRPRSAALIRFALPRPPSPATRPTPRNPGRNDRGPDTRRREPDAGRREPDPGRREPDPGRREPDPGRPTTADAARRRTDAGRRAPPSLPAGPPRARDLPR